MEQRINQKEEAPLQYYLSRYADLDPAEAVGRLGRCFDGSAFTLTFLAQTYRIAWPVYAIEPEPPLTVQTFLLRYLVEGKNLPAGGWKTFREMPWGEVYVEPFTGRCLRRCAFTFGGRLDGFCKGCQALGGTAISGADAAYEIPMVDDYRIRILLWQADEEFGPSAQILYSDNFAVGFTAEDRVVAADLLLNAVRAKMR